MTRKFLGMDWISMADRRPRFAKASRKFPQALRTGEREAARQYYNVMLNEVKKEYEKRHGRGSW